MNESSSIDRAVFVSAAFVAMLVLSGCGRFFDPAAAGGSHVGLFHIIHVSIQPVVSPSSKAATIHEKAKTGGIDGGKSATKVDAAAPATSTDGGERVKKEDAEITTTFDGVETTITNEGASLPVESDSQSYSYGKPAPRKLLPMRSLFNLNEKFMKETEDEVRLRRIMRICAC